MFYNWGQKILEKVDTLLDQLQDQIFKNKKQLQPQPIKVKSR